MIGTLATLASYLLGSIPFGYLIVRWTKGIDIRSTGSGATGATNVMRNLGVAGFLATFLLDFGKGVGAVFLAARLTGNDPRWVAAAAVGAVAGHIFPVWLGFRGGKGVATGVGVFLALAPVPMALVLLIFGALVGLFRYISLASIVATAAFPLLFAALNHPPPALLIGSVGCALLIIGRHYTNFIRLLKGTEHRLGAKARV
ncbi:MAG TPA: glycerol-3-phosphate 1-O-acyltransferase PlsY [Terriglobia bacterium]|nr:glycerol-3-phosphate 1-O-acyltransferase PlsY [Terriglobia bacterium]